MARQSKLTPAIHKHIVAAVRAGNFFSVACRSAGVAENTGREWLARGEGTDDRSSDPIYVNFAEAVRQAEVEAEMAAVKTITTSKSAAARQWYLERKYPERWGRKDKLEHSGPSGGPIVVDSAALTQAAEELKAWQQSMASQLSDLLTAPQETPE